MRYLKIEPVRVNPIFINPLENRIKLDGHWNFMLDPKECGIKEKWYKNINKFKEKITVPGCWQGQGFGYQEKEPIWDFSLAAQIFKATYKGSGWYSKVFRIPDSWKEKRIWINFGGVHPSCNVWLNGEFIGGNKYPFVPFGFDITNKKFLNSDNLLTVQVHEENRELGFSYNCQGSWSGIYRDVELTATGNSYFEYFNIYPDIENSELKYKIKIADIDKTDKELCIVIKAKYIGAEKLVGQLDLNVNKNELEANMVLPEVMGWSPDKPNLYKIDAVLKSKNAEIFDALSERSGFIKLSTKGRYFLINNEPYYMRGTGDFNSSPETGSPDINRESLKRKLSTLRKYGYNYVRCQSFVPTPEYFDIADEVGLLVQSEMGMSGSWSGFSNYHHYSWPQPMPDNKYDLKWQWDQVVRRDINHPSANIYCMSNELGCLADYIIHPKTAWKCYNDTKLLKPSAFIIWTDGGYSENLPQDFANYEVESKVNECKRLYHIPKDFVDDELKFESICKKPVIQHEYRWWTSFPDIKNIDKYNCAMRPYVLEITKKAAEEKGIASMLSIFTDNSQKLQFIESKGKIEIHRREVPYLAGICHFTAMDWAPCPSGIIDEFYEKKYCDSNDWLKTNGNTVILSGLNFDDRVFTKGDKIKVALFISDFSHPPLKKPNINWKIKSTEKIYFEGEIKYDHIPFCTCKVGEINEKLEKNIAKPVKAMIEVFVNEEHNTFSNNWDIWFFPNREIDLSGIYVYSQENSTWLRKAVDIYSFKQIKTINNCKKGEVLFTEFIDRNLAEFIKGGGKVFLSGGEGIVRPFYSTVLEYFREGKYYFTPPANYPPFEDYYHGTVINNHQMFENFPHDSFADLQFYRLINDSPAIDLDALRMCGVDPIIRVIHRNFVCRNLGHLIEFSYGKGSLIICSLNFDFQWPEARYLFSEICEYFKNNNKPAVDLTQEAMDRIIYNTSF